MAGPKARTKKKVSGRRKVEPAVLEQRRFTRAIRSMFTSMGFDHIPTEGVESKFGNKVGEIDAVYIYMNILLVVEDTTNNKPFEHAKNKRLLAEQILGSRKDFVQWLRGTFPDHKGQLEAYSSGRFRVFYLYISKVEMDLDDDELKLLEPMRVVSTQALNYFDKLARTIRRSAKTDLWRFLELKSRDIGATSATNDVKTIDTTIISPDESTGFGNGIRLVSFMISADVLLRNAYVLRKDNWGYSTELYQRLVDGSRIKKIREFVASENSAFLNNIIVGLPPDVAFQDSDKKPISLDDIQDYSAYRMTIPDEFNSLCIIDGQHRVYAHYEGTDNLEPRVAAIRGKVHLLATGLVFPTDMDDFERLRVQGEIFLDINSNTKPVPPDVLLAIQSLQAPYADAAIARRVLELMNKKSAFRNMFQLSQMDQAPVKIASIVKFALRYLVDVDSDGGLFFEWQKDDATRLKLRDRNNADLLTDYVKYCSSTLNVYFSALKSHHQEEWLDANSKATSTTVINGMIIALRRSLATVGVLPFEEYSKLVSEWQVDFSKTNFPFTSSQYARFSQVVLRDMFKLVERDGAWVRRDFQ